MGSCKSQNKIVIFFSLYLSIGSPYFMVTNIIIWPTPIPIQVHQQYCIKHPFIEVIANQDTEPAKKN